MGVTIIGGSGVDYLQDSVPTSPLLNQIWQQTSTGKRWIWNGTFWLSEQIFEISHAAHSSNDINVGSAALNDSYALQGAFNIAYDIYIKEISYSIFAINKSALNYFTIASIYADGVSGIALATTTTLEICPTHQNVGHLTKQIGIALPIPNNSNTHSLYTNYTKTGTISNLNINLFYRYQLIYK